MVKPPRFGLALLIGMLGLALLCVSGDTVLPPQRSTAVRKAVVLQHYFRQTTNLSDPRNIVENSASMSTQNKDIRNAPHDLRDDLRNDVREDPGNTPAAVSAQTTVPIHLLAHTDKTPTPNPSSKTMEDATLCSPHSRCNQNGWPTDPSRNLAFVNRVRSRDPLGKFVGTTAVEGGFLLIVNTQATLAPSSTTGGAYSASTARQTSNQLLTSLVGLVREKQVQWRAKVRSHYESGDQMHGFYGECHALLTLQVMICRLSPTAVVDLINHKAVDLIEPDGIVSVPEPMQAAATSTSFVGSINSSGSGGGYANEGGSRSVSSSSTALGPASIQKHNTALGGVSLGIAQSGGGNGGIALMGFRTGTHQHQRQRRQLRGRGTEV